MSRCSEGELTAQGEEHEESHGFESSLNINGQFMLDILVTHLFSVCCKIFFFFFKFLKFIYQRHRDRERERQRHRQRVKQAPWREPDVGLHPGSPGSCPGLKVALNR